MRLSKSVNKYYLIPAVLLTMLLILIVIFFKPFSQNVSNFFINIQNLTNTLVARISTINSSISNIRLLSEENTQLKEQYINLLQENNQLKTLKKENEQLKNLLNYSDNNLEKKFITARIFAQDPLNLSDVIVIDKGSYNGLKIGDHAIYNGIYIGQINSIMPTTSQISLVTSPQHSVVGQVSEIGVTGLVKGQLGYGLVMEDIPPDAKLSIGQIVTTASIDQDTPDNLLLGEITEIQHQDQNIFQKAILKPIFNFSDVKYLQIVSNNN